MGFCAFACMRTSSIIQRKYSLCFKHYMTNSSCHTLLQVCRSVANAHEQRVFVFQGQQLNWEWKEPQMGSFFFISKVKVLLFIWRPPTAGLSLLSAATLPGAGRDPGPFSSSLQYRVNLWAARGSWDQSWDPQVTGWPAASPLLTCIRSERKYLPWEK